MTQTGRMWGWVGGGPKGGDGLPRWLRGERLLLPMQEIGDLGSIPGSERFPEEENVNSVPYSCLGNPIDRGAWWTIVHGVASESDTTERLILSLS